MKLMQEKVQDLETTLEINKGLIQSLMASTMDSTNAGEQLKEANSKLVEENTFLKKRLKQLYQESETMNSKILLLQQMNADSKMKEHQITQNFEDQILDLKEKMEKKETYLQQKEAKWIAIEAIMKEYAEDDEELKDKFREAKFALIQSRRITNFVHESEKAKKDSKYLKNEIDRLRKLLLSKELGKIDEELIN